MALTKDDAAQIKDIVNAAVAPVAGQILAVNASIGALEKVFIEKLNGHVGEVDRLATDVDKLGGLQRKTEGDVMALTLRVVQLEGTVNKNAAVAAAQDQGHEAKAAAIDSVKSGITAMHVVWISVGATMIGAILSGLVTFWLSGSAISHP